MSLNLQPTSRDFQDAASILERMHDSLRSELDLLDREMTEALESTTELAQEVADYILKPSGKRLRASLHMLAAKACGYEGIGHVRVAAAIELIHVATLLHDDVIDHAELRRGQPSVNVRFSPSVAILMADLLYCRGFQLSLENLGAEGPKRITRATAAMCEGEIFQIQKENQILSREDYFRVVQAKTANLFGVAMELGGVLAGSPPEIIHAMRAFGENFGVAFQITDDILDYVAEDGAWGKAVGGDIDCGKQTLPFIHAMEVCDPATREELGRQILQAAATPGSVNPDEVIEIVKRHGGIEHSVEVAAGYGRRAATALQALPAGESRDLLASMAEYVACRRF